MFDDNPYGSKYHNERFKKMAEKNRKEINVTNNPIGLVAALALVFFVLELLVLANLWAINEIANFF